MPEPPEPPLQPGTITRLVAQKKDPNRVSVHLDGAFAFGVHVDLVLAYELAKGKALNVVTQEQLKEQLREQDQVLQARKRAWEYVARRPRTRDEVTRMLDRAEYAPEVIEETLAYFEDKGEIDDVAYAEAYASERFRLKGHGPMRIRRDLRKKGVPDKAIEPALDALVATADLAEAARAHAEKRWPRVAREEDPRRRKKKLSDYLRRRGFSYDIIRPIVDDLEAEHPSHSV